jgi:flagellar basal-body rod protein FlgC
MGLMTAIEIGASGLSAQRKRLEVHISNLANANVSKKPGVEPYRPKTVLFETASPELSFGSVFEDAVQGVRISKVVTVNDEPIKKHEPNHPNADKDGYVSYPNVNVMLEMGDMLSAARSYEANVQAVNTAKEMQQKTLEILR